MIEPPGPGVPATTGHPGDRSTTEPVPAGRRNHSLNQGGGSHAEPTELEGQNQRPGRPPRSSTEPRPMRHLRG
jgi:hypothetical protein